MRVWDNKHIEAINQQDKIMTNSNETMVTYSNSNMPHDLVLIKADDSFVIVGESTPSDSDLAKMTNWEEVEGWTAK